MAVLPTGIGPVTGGYQIERSLRFNSADSAYLNRTPASAGNLQTWTWSGWVKRSGLGARQAIFVCSNAAGNDYVGLEFLANDKLAFIGNDNNVTERLRLETNAVFRDPSAWYHIVVFFNSTNATPSNRAAIYVNGVLQTYSTATYMPQNYNGRVNTTNQHSLGTWLPASGLYLNGYMTEVNFINGLTPNTTTRTVNGVTQTILTELGQFNANTGVWEPAAWTRAFGTNGFFLKFADNSGTTSTTLGKDSSSNGNNWTPNLFYVGPGTTPAEKAGIDSLVDSPTSYGTDTGVGGEVRGNYCTINAAGVGVGTLSNGNLELAATASAWQSRGSTIGVTSGKWYWEVTILTGGDYQLLGIDSPSRSYVSGNYVGDATSGRGWSNAANKYVGGVATSYGASYTTNDILGFALDMDAGTLVCYKNGVSQGTAFTGITGEQAPAFSVYTSGIKIAANFGQRPFAYTAPSGFKALCTQNLTTPTIGATSTTQANKYFDTTIYTGNGAVRSITNSGSMQPDFVWDKLRSGANSHRLFDAVRGVEKALYSNLTNIETTETGTLTSFNSDGFSLGTNSETNTNTSTYVAWQWKANGAGSTNSNGTAKSSSVTVDSGTDTVTWNSHGMSDGQKIGFFAATMPGGLSAGTLYYVRDAATNTFKVAASSGGAAIDITSNGTTVTAHTTLTSTVSANTASGFSIVKHINSGAPATIEHGLGVAPKFIINKVYDRTENWRVYYGTSNKLMQLNTTSAEATDTNIWNNTNPTSNVFSIGTYFSSGDDVISYCFAEVPGYSAFGSYTGNGSTDGVFVYTGHRPRYVLLKSSTQTSPWQVFDTARDSYNVGSGVLLPNNSIAESTFATLDILSNGFKLRYNGDPNTSSQTYIYAAFAESPFKYSLAR